ncbi:Undecaprenyl pyrophosphate synthetase [Tistlia consotensis]|uniref:Isoprenyl transferase n=2 Tax=Tistlia TaxID=1321364 RepID=A0A1Y6CK29_9PROT|nr:Undecaprenyl pyrophosphate synthetase [Tistlia consotensis USBA 355]SNS04571.1 Undecaprenyl pyrophosphate synthetase [Tistlia consotensis]
MDGNGRWATARGLPRFAGHRAGAEAAKRTVRAASDLGIRYLTLFSFSSENWKRPWTEIEQLMELLRRYLRSEIAELYEEGVRLRVIGDRESLAPDIVRLVEEAEATTRDNDRLTLIMALSYGSRQELTAAARDLARDAAAGRLDPETIDERLLASRLWTADLPDPDLLIRTSGEMRISNFLLWQLAYAEFVFTDRLWPDFGRDDLLAAIDEFGRRERRFGAAVSAG